MATLLFAPAASAGHGDATADVQPTTVPGNPACPAGTTSVKFDGPTTGATKAIAFDGGTATVTLTSVGKSVSFDVDGALAGFVIIKGGEFGNLYDYRSLTDGGIAHDDGLTAPARDDGRLYGVSHVDVCLVPGGETPPAAICADGLDNDGDGKVDYPADPGCSAASDTDETDAPPKAICEDGLDNDGDGKTDYPMDPGCESAADQDEYNAPPPPAICADGMDNDGDGKTDYPMDPGCESASDQDEYNAPPAICADGLDNDGDGKTDYPMDPGCESASDQDEHNVVSTPGSPDVPPSVVPGNPTCPAGTTSVKFDVPVSGATKTVTLDGQLVTVTLTSVSKSVTFTVDGGLVSQAIIKGGTSANVYDYTVFVEGGVASDDGLTAPIKSGTQTYGVSHVDLCLVGGGGTVNPACSDTLDNDGDGKVDYPADPGCSAASDNDETDVIVPKAICEDGLDNDNDGLTDYPMDPGCESASDSDEYNAPPKAICEDGLDNDGDGKTDYPMDPGCESASDQDEYNAPPKAICEDGLDNDGDGKTDYPMDPGCESAADQDEYNAPPAICADGLDNDGDGKTDYPMDPGCESATDQDEYNAPPKAVCEDGLDNDNDGKTDYPMDPGCESATDQDESNPVSTPGGPDVPPTNVPGNPVCPSGTVSVKFEPVRSSGTQTVTVDGSTVTVSWTISGKSLSFSIDGGLAQQVIVKGGTSANVYDYSTFVEGGVSSDEGLTTPAKGSQSYGFSHLDFCLVA